jgi:dynein heavy chain
MRDDLLDEMELFPYVGDENVSFKTPSATTAEKYVEHIDRDLPPDTPIAFGMHPNAEIAFRTENSDTLLQALLDLQPRDAGAGESGATPQIVAENLMAEILERFAEVWRRSAARRMAHGL